MLTADGTGLVMLMKSTPLISRGLPRRCPTTKHTGRSSAAPTMLCQVSAASATVKPCSVNPLPKGTEGDFNLLGL